MDGWVIAMMLGASLFLGAVALAAFMWGIKNGQFDDETKMMNQVLYDDENELNDAAEQQRKKENSLKKKEYKPE
ncbi:MAG: cbb3-type cytochrome oxidase assembly protein CcoS [Sulfuricurvum sp.]